MLYRLLLLGVTALVAAGCTAMRYPGTGPQLHDYDYCVVNPDKSSGYVDQAKEILSSSFIILEPKDLRLSDPEVRRSTCEAVVSWTRGFFSVTGWVEISDYESGEYVMISQTRRGLLYIGAPANVLESLNDIAAARASGPPLPSAGTRGSATAATTKSPATTEAPSPLERRLRELDQLLARKVISQSEYEAARSTLLSQ